MPSKPPLPIGAAEFLPARLTMPALRKAVQACEGCDLFRHATQAVFGEGSNAARIVLVGEQPGDQEDRIGKPFVGPAGHLLDECLAEAGIARDEIYLTNAVKHFKFTERGKRRLHGKPNSREIAACRPWLEAEFAAIEPEMLILLGATAAQAIFGAAFRITVDRGKWLGSRWCEHTLATWHPSAVLRAPDDDRRQAMRHELVGDLRRAAKLLKQS